MEGKLILITGKNPMVITRESIVKNDWCLLFDSFDNLFLGADPQQYKGEESGQVLNEGLRKVYTGDMLDTNGFELILNKEENNRELFTLGELTEAMKHASSFCASMKGINQYIDNLLEKKVRNYIVDVEKVENGIKIIKVY